MQKQKTNRVPKCGYCANHGIKNPLRAHKRDCKFLDCVCKLCAITRLKREHMADMQYIKRNGIVEYERIQNEQDAEVKKKQIYVKIFQERMANKNKKRIMKDLKNCAPDTLAETSSSAAVSPNSNSSIGDPAVTCLPQLATLTNLRAFTSNSIVNNLACTAASSLDSSPNLEPTTLTGLHSSRSPFSSTALFTNSGDSSKTSDQFLKAAKLLGIGLNLTQTSSSAASTPLPFNTFNINSLTDHTSTSSFRNEDVDLNEITELIDRLSIVNKLNDDESMLNAAICILFNGLPLTLLNPGNVAEEIYSTYKQLSSTKMFR